MAPKLRLRSALACNIVRLDRQKFNEAVADGFYACAPASAPGATRLFTEEQLIPLYLFARLLDLGLTPRRAGAVACDAASLARSDRIKGDRIVLVRGETEEVLFPAEHYDPDHEAKGQQYHTLGPVVLTVEFSIDRVRKIIADRIEEERSILGTDE